MLLAVKSAISRAVLAGRRASAEVFGVVDLTTKAGAKIAPITLGMAIQFVANASVLDTTFAEPWSSTANRRRRA